jgi:hypothetical protein
MFIRHVAFATIVLLSASSAHARAEQAAQPAAENKVSITATVEAIDQTNRTVMLKGPRGNVVEVYVDPAYKRFDQLKVGDEVTATYYESIVAHIRQPGEPAPKPTSEGVTPRKDGPGGTAAVQDTVTVVVESVDRANRSVTVKKQDGGIVSMRVENPKYLEAAKPGQTVDITYTRALLIEANPAKK